LIPIVFADDLPLCECCEEPWCPEHADHYADCGCLGPSEAVEQGYVLVEIDGKLFAAKE